MKVIILQKALNKSHLSYKRKSSWLGTKMEARKMEMLKFDFTVGPA
jgi:hypothetical protein